MMVIALVVARLEAPKAKSTNYMPARTSKKLLGAVYVKLKSSRFRSRY